MDVAVRELIEQQIFGKKQGRRFTQDSPILTDVWIAFGENQDQSQDLIILPHREDSTGRIAEDINQKLASRRAVVTTKKKTTGKQNATQKRDSARIAHLPGVIAVRLYFDDLLWLVLPKTRWWHERVNKYISTIPSDSDYAIYRHFPSPVQPAPRKTLRQLLITDIKRVEDLPTHHANIPRDKSVLSQTQIKQ